ncbi:hypothetical protein CHS0354_022801 [Potamilus streckersoni]|uniref:Uncharacterized protein n=1 Tax=Potamilus streckersoni TaxID=2493646 RepID=A0AAE0S2I0_9BIVA|nr:hypothetical protein CHS0354_022801 [Potamilus streckersoni]
MDTSHFISQFILDASPDVERLRRCYEVEEQMDDLYHQRCLYGEQIEPYRSSEHDPAAVHETDRKKLAAGQCWMQASRGYRHDFDIRTCLTNTSPVSSLSFIYFSGDMTTQPKFIYCSRGAAQLFLPAKLTVAIQNLNSDHILVQVPMRTAREHG